jgi:hypothetical protein
VNAALLRWLLIIAALVLSLFALLAAVVSGFSAPHWVLPAACVAGFAALAIPAP